MKKLLILSLLSMQLLAQNPKLFDTLGNQMYNTIEEVKLLEDIVVFQNNATFIKKYIKDTESLWAEGILLDDSSKAELKKNYLNNLRTLAKGYDNVMRSVNRRLEESIKNSDAKSFAQIIDTNLTPVGAETPEVISFYKKHVQSTIKVERLESYLESIKPPKKPITVAGPSKVERIEAKAKEIERQRRLEQDKIEKEKKKALINEQIKESK